MFAPFSWPADEATRQTLSGIGEVLVTIFVIAPQTWTGLSVGQKVPIRFDKDDPHVVRLQDW